MTEKLKNYTALEKKQEELSHLEHILGLLHWDSSVMLKSGSAANRHKEIATFGALCHRLQTGDEFRSLLENAEQEMSSLDGQQQVNLKLIRRNYDHATCLTEDIQHKHSMACSASEFAWRKARAENDFASYAEHLDKVFDSVRDIAKIKSDKFGVPEYDVLLDSFDPGRKSSEIKSVYDQLKQELPDLYKEIGKKQQQEDVLPLKDKISEDTQKQIGLHVMKDMGFDFDRGRLDKSTHPFCSGTNDDVRITTRYDENNFISSLYGVIHETGHALYQLNLPDNYRNQPASQPLGMAFHESQSLIMELQACNSIEFTEYLSKILRDEFSLTGAEYSPENLYKLITRVKPSFIRVDADEVTYPLHIILRYEIEQDIIYNGLKAKDLPALWDDKMVEYLGIRPQTYSDGCLQDIHWPSGAIGYFPSYTNGAIIASMLMKNATNKHPEIYSDIRRGKFNLLNDFLTNNLRSHGSSLESDELLKESTGHSQVNADIFLDYLRRKYL